MRARNVRSVVTAPFPWRAVGRGCITVLSAAATFGSVFADSRNLYEWSAVAPEVVVATVLGPDGKFVLARIEESFRGGLAAGDEIRIDLRSANRERTSLQNPLRLGDGETVVMLLEESDRQRSSKKRPAYDIVRGVNGTREVPAEGREAIFSALRTFVEIQDLKDFNATWERFARLLGDRNPIVLETVLDQYYKFSKVDPELLPSVEPLLDHPRPSIRERAADVIGLVFTDLGSEQVEGVAAFQPALMALARRDPAVEVRIAATRALGSVRGPRTTAMLEEIAADDPEQVVRYHAQRLLLEHRMAEAAKARATGDGRIRSD